MKPKPLFPQAHVITRLSALTPAQHTVDEWHEPHGALQSVASLEQHGTATVIKHVRLGASGIQVLRHTGREMIAVCIPVETLFAFAAEINPQFNAAPNQALPEADVALAQPAT